MSLYPEDNDKDIVEQVNEQYRDYENQKNQPHGDESRARYSKITTPDEDEAETLRKKQMLANLIDVSLDEKMKPIRAQIEQIPNLINLSIQQAFQSVQEPQDQNQNPLTQLGSSPQLSPEALGPLMTGLAQILQAWRGGNNTMAQPDPFGEMFKQLGINIMQAGVDGIYKQVYDGYQPQPKSPQLQPGINPNQNNQSTGFR